MMDYASASITRCTAWNPSRSINSEIIVRLERTLRGQQINPEAILTTARRIREITAEYPITD